MQMDDRSGHRGSADAPLDPIIVTGAPRTGVRLLAAVLDGHPTLASGPDLPVVTTLVRQWHEIHENLGSNHERNHGVSSEASRGAFREAALKLVAQRLKLTGKRRFVLQTFSAAMLLNQFAAVFPAARFILMVRDPRAVVRSLLQCDWRDTRSGEPLPYTRDPASAARFSLDCMHSCLRNARALEVSGRLMALRYEQLCANPDAAMARLGTMLDEVPPQPRVLPASAVLVAESPDNRHPPLRPGALQATSAETAHDPGETTPAIERLRRLLGYGDG
jgi:hypothetical protein